MERRRLHVLVPQPQPTQPSPTRRRALAPTGAFPAPIADARRDATTDQLNTIRPCSARPPSAAAPRSAIQHAPRPRCLEPASAAARSAPRLSARPPQRRRPAPELFRLCRPHTPFRLPAAATVRARRDIRFAISCSGLDRRCRPRDFTCSTAGARCPASARTPGAPCFSPLE